LVQELTDLSDLGHDGVVKKGRVGVENGIVWWTSNHHAFIRQEVV